MNPADQLADALAANDRLTRTIARLRDDLAKPTTPGLISCMQADCDIALADAAPRAPHPAPSATDVLGWLEDISASIGNVARIATSAEAAALANIHAAAALLAGGAAVCRTRSHVGSIGGVVEDLAVLAENMAERIQRNAVDDAAEEIARNLPGVAQWDAAEARWRSEREAA